MKRIFLFSITLLCLLSFIAAYAGEKVKIEDNNYKNETMGIHITTPDGEWSVEDRTQGTSMIAVLFKKGAEKFKCAIVMTPGKSGLDSAEKRDKTFSKYFGDKYKLLDIKEDTIGGKRASVHHYNIEKDSQKQRACAYIVTYDGNVYSFEILGPPEEWEKEFDSFYELFKSTRFFKRKKAGLIKRPKMKKIPQNCRVIHHDIDLEIFPSKGSMEVEDSFRLKILKGGTKEIYFSLADLKVDSIMLDGKDLKFSLKQYGLGRLKWLLTVQLPKEYPAGTELTLHYKGYQNNFHYMPGAKLIANLGELGQVDEKSSFSSHVYYYPEDELRTTTANVKITVPEGYTAVSVGKLEGVKTKDNKTTFHWKTDIATPRILPYAFAVAKYEKFTKKSKTGYPIEVYSWKEYEKQAKQRVKVGKDIVDFYTDKFGPLEFEKIALVHIKPKKGIMGVSLPTMTMFSDKFFAGECSYESLKGSDLAASSGVIVTADEISHQWNCYSVAFPNQMAEGMAEYCDGLVTEHFGGKKPYRRFMQREMDGYKEAVRNFKDVPIASEKVYQTQAYGAIAFSKNAVVQDMLRYIMGDEKFFAAMKHIFKAYRGKRAGFKDYQKAMEKYYGESLEWFFKEWFYGTGYPSYEVSMEKPVKEGDKYKTGVFVKQLQEGEPFVMLMDVTFYGEGKEKTFSRKMVDVRNEKLTFHLDFKPEKVEIDKNGILLKDVVYK